MSETNVEVKKNSKLLWAVRIMYIVIALSVVYKLVTFLLYRTSYYEELADWFFRPSLMMFGFYFIALVAQFPYIFLKKPGKIKGNTMLLIGIVLRISDELYTQFYNISMNIAYGTSIMEFFLWDLLPLVILIGGLALFIVYYYFIKRLNKDRLDVVDGENYVPASKKLMKKIKDNRM